MSYEDVLWDALARLGFVDERGSAEYEREMAERGDEFAKAAWLLMADLQEVREARLGIMPTVKPGTSRK